MLTCYTEAKYGAKINSVSRRTCAQNISSQIVFIAKAMEMLIKFLLCIQLYQDQNIAVSSFVTVDKYQQ